MAGVSSHPGKRVGSQKEGVHQPSEVGTVLHVRCLCGGDEKTVAKRDGLVDKVSCQSCGLRLTRKRDPEPSDEKKVLWAQWVRLCRPAYPWFS